MFWHIDTDIISLLVVCALYVYTVTTQTGQGNPLRDRWFGLCLRAGIVVTVIDIAASVIMEVPVSRLLYHLLMSLYFISIELVILCWLNYAVSILYHDDEARRKTMSRLLVIPFALYVCLVLSNPWTGLIYTLGPDMAYARGPLFYIMILLYALYVLALLGFAVLRRRHVPEGYPQSVLVLVPLVLAVSIPVQLLNPGWLMIVPCYVVCLVLSVLFLQTVRLRDEQAQLEQLTQMVEHFACGLAICQITPDGAMDIQYISRGLANICELDASELQRRLRADILTGVHLEDRELVAAHLKDMTRLHAAAEVSYRYNTDTGRLKRLNIHAEVEEQPDGSATVYATYTDLTELKKAEQIIDVALANTGVSIWEYDFARRCIIQYQNSTEMHGFERIVPDVPRSLVDSGFVHPDSAAAFLEMYDKLFAGEAFAEGVFKVQTSDRRGYWYEHIRYTNALDEHGKPYRAVGMSTDETQRQETIAKYQRELEKERGILVEEGLLAHAVYNLNTGETLESSCRDDVQAANRQTVFFFGQGNAELLIDEAERSAFLALNDAGHLVERFASGETEFRLDYRRRLPAKGGDGERICWVRSTLHLVRDPTSEHILLFEYWYDIEQEKMQELMFRSIATDNYDFVARIDGRTRQFVVLSKAELQDNMPPASGDDADLVTQQLRSSSVLPEDRALVIHNLLVDTILENLRENGRFTFTFREQREDGTIRYKRITQYYIDAQRQIIALLQEDVTELILAETQKSDLLASALRQANQASEAKSQFLSRVSHELRTPLNAILGFIELSKDADHETVEEYMSNSDTAAKQLLSIINDVLDMSSIEAGKLKLASAPFDLNQLLDSITVIYAAQCRQKGLDYETRRLNLPDTRLLGDQMRVNQILMNLLGNAVKFTQSGSICLTVEAYDQREERVFLRFQVRDTGCGMSEDMLSRLFRAFEQQSAVTAQKYGGNGLGLSIVGSLVEMMQGRVWAESSLGEGSVFTVELGFARSTQLPQIVQAAEVATQQLVASDDRSGPARASFAGKRILLAEDNAMNRMVAEGLIRRFGIACDTAADGQIAVDLYAAAEPGYYNAILMDIQMPNLDGFQATHAIRASRRADAVSIPIIALTANAFQEDVNRSLASGMNAHVAKPIDPTCLADCLETAFLGRY